MVVGSNPTRPTKIKIMKLFEATIRTQDGREFKDYETNTETFYKEIGYVKESKVTEEIRADLLHLGQTVIAN